MRHIVFDIETSNLFSDVERHDPTLLDLAVVCIYDSATDSYHSYFQEELPALWSRLEHTEALVGWNSDHFDIPLLNKYYPGDLTLIKSIDLMKEVQKAMGRRLKLDTVAEATLGENKTADGLQALQWWKAGERDRVKEYCLKDVEITKKIFDYARTHGTLKYKDFGKVHEVALDTAAWAQKETRAMTHTLPF